jgi:hypothetical protein
MLAVLALALLVHHCLLQTDAFAAHQPATTEFTYCQFQASQSHERAILEAESNMLHSLQAACCVRSDVQYAVACELACQILHSLSSSLMVARTD